MKEKLYTIPMMDALRAQDECPFCFIERSLEQHALDSVLGAASSYMQDDVRAETDRVGFCREHYHKMFAYGNPMGNSLILETHLRKLMGELKKEMHSYSETSKVGLMERLRKDTSASADRNNVSRWIHTQEHSCHICNIIKKNYDRYLATFFVLYQQGDEQFMDLLKNSKGLCIHHLGDVLDATPLYLNDREQKQLRELLFPMMENNLDRILEELEWFQKKFDYRYRDADWKNSEDAVPRTMQKIAGGYPADPPYKAK